MSKNTRNRILLTAIAALLLVAVTVGGTLAWLYDNTDAVTNTFTPAKIEIELTETEKDWAMQLIPGTEKAKDPKVTVKTSVEAYVFVQFDCTVAEGTNTLTYDFLLNNTDSGWTQLPGTDNVWYTTVAAGENGAEATYSWELLVGNKVSVPNAAAGSDVANGFTMAFDAWTIQTVKETKDGAVVEFTPAEAWAQVNP